MVQNRVVAICPLQFRIHHDDLFGSVGRIRIVGLLHLGKKRPHHAFDNDTTGIHRIDTPVILLVSLIPAGENEHGPTHGAHLLERARIRSQVDVMRYRHITSSPLQQPVCGFYPYLPIRRKRIRCLGCGDRQPCKKT
ncbi:hypothetical protein ES703_116107 [subsurface metagenome]